MDSIRKNHMAKMFAMKLVNGTMSDLHKNRHVVDLIYTQFLKWDDLEHRLNQQMFQVDVISATGRIPNFSEVYSYCVTADWLPAAATKVADLLALDFGISAGPTKFFSSGYMMQVSPWTGELYGIKQFEIL